MANRELFRKKPLEKLTSQVEIDEALEVRVVGAGLILWAILFLIIAGAIWLFWGSVQVKVGGFGVIEVYDPPVGVLAANSGRVDTLCHKPGELVKEGEKLVRLDTESGSKEWACAPSNGEITSYLVRKGQWVQAGTLLLRLVESHENRTIHPELVFWVSETDVFLLKEKMKVSIQSGINTLPENLSDFTVSFISKYPLSRYDVENYLANKTPLTPEVQNWYEVRASLASGSDSMTKEQHAKMLRMNGLTCRVSVWISRQSPGSLLLQYFLSK